MIKFNFVSLKLLIVTIALSCAFFVQNSAFANFYSGPGTTPDASGATCYNFRHGFIYECPEYNDGGQQVDSVGGASWRIYHTSDNPYSVLSYNGDILNSDKRGDILAEGACKNYDYYVVYSWDGRLRENGVTTNPHVYYGPLTYGTKVGGKNIQYNNWDAIDNNGTNYVELAEILSKGNFNSGDKISEQGAINLYKIYSEGENLTKHSNVGFFCASKDITNYYARSYVSLNSNEAHTEITQSGKATASSASIKTNESASLKFSHNIYADKQTNNVPWQMQRSLHIELTDGSEYDLRGFQWSRFFDFSTASLGSWSGSANLTIPDGNYNGKQLYAAEGRTYSSGGQYFLTHDDYNIKFKIAGSYTFCETMYVGPSTTKMTEVCATVNVDGSGVVPPPPVLSLCDTWEHADYTRSYYNSSSSAEGWTFTRSGVRNLDAGFDWAVSNGKNFSSDPVYARPYQELEWNHCYYPGVQKMAKSTSRAIVSTGWGVCWHWETHDYVDNVITPWENKYQVFSSSNMPKTKLLTRSSIGGAGGPFGTGNTDIRSWGIDTYTVETGYDSKAGETLTETMTSGTPQYVKVQKAHKSKSCCDHSCTCGEGEDAHSCCCDSGDSVDYNAHTKNTSPYSDTAMVKVPYNYIIDNVNVSINETEVAAGETANVEWATFDVIPKDNEVTNGTYATKVDGGQAKLIAFLSGSNQTGHDEIIADGIAVSGSLCYAIDENARIKCSEIAHESKTYNYPENTDGSSETRFQNTTYNVFDAPAGYWYCIVAAAYPATSGSDTNMNPGGDNTWRLSAPDCVQIVKKPSLQVWGNSLYTSSHIFTSVSPKRVVDGFYEYTPTSASNTTIFGSWVEQSIFTPNAQIYGLASGAATGRYSSGNNTNGNTSSRTPAKRLGGSHEGNLPKFCIRSPLTMPNTFCNYENTTAYYIGGGYSSVSKSAPDDKSSILGRYFNETDFFNKDTGCVDKTSKTSDESKLATVCYAGNESNGQTLTIGPKQIAIGKTYLYYADKINIDGDILYPYNDNSDKGYSSLYEIPKVIIYSKGDIDINCAVKRVDAVLIAEGDIDTCPAFTYALENGIEFNEGDVKASTQLKIFGTVITNTMTPNRTYGASVGKYSGVPAEIIDYDTSLYLWGMSRATVNKSGKAEVTYQTELSPRY